MVPFEIGDEEGLSTRERERERDREGSAGPRGTRTPHSASGPAVCGENRLCWGLVSVGAVLTYSDLYSRPRHFLCSGNLE